MDDFKAGEDLEESIRAKNLQMMETYKRRGQFEISSLSACSQPALLFSGLL